MMSKILQHLFLGTLGLFLLGLATGCQSDNTPPGVSVDIPSSFSIQMIETLDTVQQKFGILASTLEDQDCLNYSIDYSFDRLNGVITISLNDLLPPDDCLPGIAPAQSKILVGYLVNGYFNLELNIKNTIKNTGLLSVTSEAYSLTMESEDGLIISNETLYRIPKEAVWGYVNYSEQAYEIPALDFMQELWMITQEQPVYQGDYYHFKIMAANKVLIPTQPSDLYSMSFIRSFTGERQELVDLVESFRSNFPDQLEIRLFTTDGLEL